MFYPQQSSKEFISLIAELAHIYCKHYKTEHQFKEVLSMQWSFQNIYSSLGVTSTRRHSTSFAQRNLNPCRQNRDEFVRAPPHGTALQSLLQNHLKKIKTTLSSSHSNTNRSIGLSFSLWFFFQVISKNLVIAGSGLIYSTKH